MKAAAPLACSFALLLLVAPLHADDPAPADGSEKGKFGHSSHGEAFNEGPRQAAMLMPGTGAVHFPITTKNELAQKFFDQGVGQLHGFWYFEAERSFRQVAMLDPECAMAYWGLAMANLHNGKRGAEFIQKAVALRDKASPREKSWVSTMADYHAETKKPEAERRQALIRALEKLSFDFPDDIEAKAFLAFWIWDSKGKGVPYSSTQAVDALCNEVLAANPMHPMHHYRIHIWNDADDRRAVNSAALCGQAAPAIAHMWHMPGHTFTKLKRYADAAWQQEAAARVDHAHMHAARILPEQIHNYAHNNDWLVENLQFVGRVRDAMELAKNMIELPRLVPRAHTVGKAAGYEGNKGGYAMGRNRLLETALRYELWTELTALDGSTYLAPADDPLDEVKRLRALGVAHFGRNNREKGEAQLTALEGEAKKAREARVAAADAAEAEAKKAKKTPEEITRAMADALQRFSKRIEATDSALAEVRLYRALSMAQIDEAKAQLPLVKNLPAERAARVHLLLGDKEAAEKLAREAVDKGEGQVLPLAILADLLWRIDKRPAALEAFQKLRPLAAQADLDALVFTRLTPIVRELGLPADWRPKTGVAPDAGVRPDLAKLGPFRWRPYEAKDWSLSDQTGRQTSLAEFRGRPVVIMFYLGSGCSHCIEQLNVFGPMTKAYADAGISLLAVSTDTADALHKTFAQAEGSEGFPFPILADPTLETFKAYRAFDDFEKIALHGTFLIDGTGNVRWQDISYQPFRDAQWLLNESKRLLALPTTFAGTTTSALPIDDSPVAATQ